MSTPELRLDRPPRDCPPNLADLAAERERFALEVPERFNPVLAIVETWAAEDPDAPAVLSIDGDGEVVELQTAADLARSSREAARVLLDLGVGKGDHVFVMLPRVPAWYAAILGAIRIGAIPMPGPNLLMPKDIADRIDRSGATAAITDAAGAGKVQEAAPGLAVKLLSGPATDAPEGWGSFEDERARVGDGETPQDPTHRDDPMLLYFTSGTVSAPKMVEHPQSYGLGHVSTARFWHDLRPGDLHWTVTDTGWAKAAYGGLFGQMHERACIANVALGRPTPDAVLGIIARYGVTSFCAPPTLYRSLVQADFSAHDLSALRHCTGAGEPLNPGVIEAWQERTGLTIHDGYGQTETTLIVGNFRSVEVRPGSMGRPMPGWDVTIVGDDGEETAPGDVGEVVVRYAPDRPVGLFPGYHGNAEATAEVFREPYYYLGDRASKDEDGRLWFEARGDDVITSSAYRIGPFEVESAVGTHPAVVESAVVGRADEERTQVVVAVCILADGYEGSPELAKEIQDHVKASTAPYKYPREVHFVEELPKTVSGKIRRTEIRDWLADGTLPKP